jgi:uncharacterized protein YeaO (DUF488 family)
VADGILIETLIKTKRWNDAVENDDGRRVLVCRYRPRGVRKDDERWAAWVPQLGPSRELHADIYGKHGAPITWTAFRARYLAEMRARRAEIAALADRAATGEPVTLLCSSACVDPARCHRSLLKTLIDRALRARSARADRPPPRR